MGDVLQMRRYNLKNMGAVRKYLAGVINRVESGELAPEKAKALGYLIQTLKAVIESASMEKQLKELERSQKNGPTGVVK